MLSAVHSYTPAVNGISENELIQINNCFTVFVRTQTTSKRCAEKKYMKIITKLPSICVAGSISIFDLTLSSPIRHSCTYRNGIQIPQTKQTPTWINMIKCHLTTHSQRDWIAKKGKINGKLLSIYFNALFSLQTRTKKCSNDVVTSVKWELEIGEIVLMIYVRAYTNVGKFPNHPWAKWCVVVDFLWQRTKTLFYGPTRIHNQNVMLAIFLHPVKWRK